MRTSSGADRERGMILINVLLIVALASAVVVMMLSAEDASLHRTGRLAEAGRARAAALGGEASAVVALRRDAVVGGASDDATEPWAALAAHDVAIPGGSFDLSIADAEDRFNINLLAGNDPATAALATRIATTLSLPPDLVAGIQAYLHASGPVTDLGSLSRAGLRPDIERRLRTLVTALPEPTRINVNSANEELLGLLLGDPVAAHQLISVRQGRGRLVPADFAEARLSLPPIAGYTSQTFWVRTRVRIGDTSQTLTSLIHRSGHDVAVIGRWWGHA